MFLHIPKTGGTWIRYVLDYCTIEIEDYELQHANFEECTHLFPDIPRFTIIRNPFDWYASYWTMRQIDETVTNRGPREWELDLDPVDDDFNVFVQTSCSKYPGFLGGVYNQFARPSVLILRTESLRQDFANHLTDIEEQFDSHKLYNMPIPNLGASGELFRDKVVYTEETGKLLAHSERETFRRFGYSTQLLQRPS